MPFEYNCGACGTACSVRDRDWAWTIAGNYGWPVVTSEDGSLRSLSGDSRMACRTCWDAYYSTVDRATCPCCDRNVQINELSHMRRDVRPSTRPGVQIGCNHCINETTFICQHCGEYANRENNEGRHTSGNFGLTCEECYQSFYSECHNCGNACKNAYIQSWHGNPHCEECYGAATGDKPIFNYSFKPKPKFFGSKRHNEKALYFGCELEVAVDGDYDDIKEKAVEVAALMKERAYLKKDSSIGRGFEVVTHPHTWEEIRKLWQEQWHEDIPGLSSHTSGTCGFHVHVSRAPLTKMHIQKIVVFVNAPENHDLVKTVAQRACNKWGILKADKKIGHCSHSQERYEAVNLENKHTIEFRIFRGNMRKDRILKNLEFVKATIDFTRDRSYRELSAGRFLEFVKTNRKEFPNLDEYLSSRAFHPNPRYVGTRTTEK